MSMKPTFHARLVNDPLGDPGLYVDFQLEKRALLFDLGDVSRLSAAQLLKVSDVFVSHTHIDHFIGFDRLLRIAFGRSKTLRLYGPEGFIKNVEGKLAGFTWNLVDRYEESIHLEVVEVSEGHLKKMSFRAIDKFQPSAEEELPFDGKTLLDEPGFTVETSILEHRIPCLGFAIQGKIHLNVDKQRLEEMHLQPGRWLNELKQSVCDGTTGKNLLQIPVCDEKGKRVEEFSTEYLEKELIVTTPGQKVAYITDTVYNESNAPRIVALVQGADLFFCESPFLAEETERARDRCHLTSRQAGLLAREAGVQRLRVFHFSSKHTHQTERLIQEAEEAFGTSST